MGVFGQQGGVSSRYVRYLASYAVPEDHICPCLPGTKLARGFILARLHDSIEMNAKCQVIISSYEILGLFPLTRSFCSFSSIEGKKFCMWGWGIFYERASRHMASTRGPPSEPAGQHRAKSEVGLNNLVTGADVRDFPRW